MTFSIARGGRSRNEFVDALVVDDDDVQLVRFRAQPDNDDTVDLMKRFLVEADMIGCRDRLDRHPETVRILYNVNIWNRGK